jgi:hypothetical protein
MVSPSGDMALAALCPHLLTRERNYIFPSCEIGSPCVIELFKRSIAPLEELAELRKAVLREAEVYRCAAVSRQLLLVAEPYVALTEIGYALLHIPKRRFQLGEELGF